MDELERSGCATTVAFLSFVLFALSVGWFTVFCLTTTPGGGIAAFGPAVMTLVGSAMGVIASTIGTVVAGCFRRKMLWMLTLQLPACAYFIYLWSCL